MVFGTDPPITRLDPFSMPESEFTAEDVLKNPVLIKTFSWSTTDEVLKNLANFSIPGIVADTVSFHQKMLQVYAYYRPQFTIRVQVNSTKFHQGRLAAWYDPFNQHRGAGSNGTKVATRAAITGLPHSMIDASLSNVVEFEIPYEHIQTALTTNSKDTLNEMGRYNISVFNSLKAASGTTSTITVNVFLSASIIKLHVPIHPHTADVQVAYEAQGFLGDLLNTAAPALEAGGKSIFNILTGNYSGALSEGSKALAGGSSLLKTFNLDKPTNPLNGTENMLTRPAPLAHCNGVDSSIRLGNSSMGGYLCHQEFSSTTEQEMLIQNLIKIPMYVQNLSWKATDPVNKVLLSIPICPSYCGASDTTESVTNQIGEGKSYTVSTKAYLMDNTYLSYLSSMFLFWRGPIKYRFDVVSTQFHTGRLGMQFVPNHDLTDPASWSLTDRSQDPLTIFDIHEMKSIEVEVPYFSSTMSKTWAPLNQVYSKGGSDYISDNVIIGYLHVYIQNALAAPVNVTSEVEVNLYISAGDNFELDVLALRPNVGFIPSPNAYPLQLPVDDGLKPVPYEAQMYVAQMGEEQAVPTRSEHPAVQTEQTKGPPTVVPYDRFGDQLRDVREIGRRFVKCGTIFVPLQLDKTYLKLDALEDYALATYKGAVSLSISPFNPCPEGRFADGGVFNNQDFVFSDYHIPSAAVARLFATWHGSMRYKIVPLDGRKLPGVLGAHYIPDNNAWTPLLDTYPYAYSSNKQRMWDWSSYPSLVTNNNQNAGLEIEVPYYSPYQQLVTEGNDGGALRTYVSGRVMISYNTTSLEGTLKGPLLAGFETRAPCVGFEVYMALGDDFSFGFPVAPPRTYYVYETQVKEITP